MFSKTPKFKQLEKMLGDEGVNFLSYALGRITRILPHTEVSQWSVNIGADHFVKWASPQRKELKIAVGIHLKNKSIPGYCLRTILQRKKAPRGIGRIGRTIDERERDICKRIIDRTSLILTNYCQHQDNESLRAIKTLFDEQIVASHIQNHHKLQIDVSSVIEQLRNLAGQSYENKQLSFGCLLDPQFAAKPAKDELFPDDVLIHKRYKALSDGYRTCYRVSTNGKIVQFEDLISSKIKSKGTHFYPEWCEHLARNSQGEACGVCLTPQGDILIFDAGTLRFTYRHGEWQYWNHTHIIDLLKNRARAQGVGVKIIAGVAQTIYRAALDVSFRRSGGLLVLLHDRKRIHDMTLKGDAIDDRNRKSLHRTFDESLPSTHIQKLPRQLLVELASLDGAVVLNNSGKIMAYGAVLNPRRKGIIGIAEGSRTKAAIGASKYGIAVKISSDGDMVFYEKGKPFFEV